MKRFCHVCRRCAVPAPPALKFLGSKDTKKALGHFFSRIFIDLIDGNLLISPRKCL